MVSQASEGGARYRGGDWPPADDTLRQAVVRGGGSHELANGVKEIVDGLIVTFEMPLQFAQFAGQGLVGAQHPTQTHKGTHDGDVDLHGTFAPQHAGKHGHALFGESVRVVASSAALL